MYSSHRVRMVVGSSVATSACAKFIGVLLSVSYFLYFPIQSILLSDGHTFIISLL